MSQDKPYHAQTSYHFEFCGEDLMISDGTKDWVEVEEVRKNGQEDTHMRGCLVKNCDGLWHWDYADDGSSFETYGSKHLRAGIQEYLNRHGSPFSD